MSDYPLKSVCPISTQRELLPPSHSSPRSGGPGDDGPGEPGEERGRDRPSGQSHTHSLRRNGTIHHPRTANPDPSCLLTPPNTPLYPEGGGGGGPVPLIGTNVQTNGCTGRTVAECKKTNGLITNGLEGRPRYLHEVDKIAKTNVQILFFTINNKYQRVIRPPPFTKKKNKGFTQADFFLY